MMAQNGANNVEVPDTPKVIQQLTMSHYNINVEDEWIYSGERDAADYCKWQPNSYNAVYKMEKWW